MYLDDDGLYYFDKDKNYELSKIIEEEVKKNFTNKYEGTYKCYLSGIQFEFKINFGNLFVEWTYNDKKNSKILTFFPLNAIFYVGKNKFERKIFSREQFDKNIKNYGFIFPWSKTTLLSKTNLDNLIYHSIPLKKNIEIEDLDIFNTKISNESKPINKFNDLSEYISYYIKSEINLNKYEEKDFIKEEDYIIKGVNNFNYYMPNERHQLAYGFEYMCKAHKEYFFSGNVSIGKTFTLLGLINWKAEDRRRAYYNLEVLDKSDEYFKIIAYESRNLFNNQEEWIKSFHKIEEENLKTPLSMILSIIKDVSQMKNENMNYIFIIDQIKFDDITKDSTYEEMNSIRTLIKQTNNCFLIGCLSINYKGTKQILFYNWFKKYDFPKEELDTKLNIPSVEIIDLNFNDDDVNNKFLKVLGNLPRFRHIQDKLNIKIVNIIVKKIKEKIKKFYAYDELLTFKNLENIPINIPMKQKDFESLLYKIPFKYLKIDIEKKIINYSFPLVKTAIDELLYSHQINNYSGWNAAEFGWYNERKVIDLIKTSHKFCNYYVDNSYEIPSIYFKYKINNEFFDLTENSLFYFSYFNVRRYDCAIYFGSEKSLLLIQITTNRTKEQLKKYNKTNIDKDIDSMQKFLLENNLIINKYYLLFILTLNDSNNSNVQKIFNESGLKYCLYNIKENKLEEDTFPKYKISEYREPNIINTEEKFIFFSLVENTFKYDTQKYGLKCYAEKGMSLDDFLEQFLDDELQTKLIEEFNLDVTSYYLVYAREYYPKLGLMDMELDNYHSYLYLNYSESIVYIGKGIAKKFKLNFSFETYKLTFGEGTKKELGLELPTHSMKGFIFKGKLMMNYI